jgi:transcriptional regulator with XRE-family HTH domain
MAFGDWLRTRREAMGLSQAKLGQKVGVDGQTISNLETGKTRSPKLKNIAPLAEALSVSVEDLMVEIGKGSPDPEPTPTALRDDVLIAPVRMVKVLTSVKASGLAYHPDESGETQIPFPGPYPDAFGAKVSGDCMEPDYRDGELVVFSRQAWEADGFLPGRDYYVRVRDAESATFKRFLRMEGETAVFQCVNTAKYPKEIRISGEHDAARCVGSYNPR